MSRCINCGKPVKVIHEYDKKYCRECLRKIRLKWKKKKEMK